MTAKENLRTPRKRKLTDSAEKKTPQSQNSAGKKTPQSQTPKNAQSNTKKTPASANAGSAGKKQNQKGKSPKGTPKGMNEDSDEETAPAQKKMKVSVPSPKTPATPKSTNKKAKDTTPVAKSITGNGASPQNVKNVSSANDDDRKNHSTPKNTSKKKNVTMSRKKRSIRENKIIDPERLQQAMEAVRGKGLSQRKASKLFKVPYLTLNDKLRRIAPILPKMAPKQTSLLTPQDEMIEKCLVEYLIRVPRSEISQSLDDIRNNVRDILDTTVGTQTSKPLPAWVYRFLDRHPELRSSKNLGTAVIVNETPTPSTSLNETPTSSISPNIPPNSSTSSDKTPAACTSSIKTTIPSTYSNETHRQSTSSKKTSSPSTSLIETRIPSTSSLAVLPLPSESSSSEPFLNACQLKAFKEFGLFLYDDMGRIQFLNFLSVMAGTNAAPSGNETFDSFKEYTTNLLKSLRTDVQMKQNATRRTPKMRLAFKEILDFEATKGKGKGAKNKKIVPHCCDLGEAKKRKTLMQQNVDTEKLAKRTLREENKRKKEEEKASLKRKRELKREARLNEIENAKIRRREEDEKEKQAIREMDLDPSNYTPI